MAEKIYCIFAVMKQFAYIFGILLVISSCGNKNASGSETNSKWLTDSLSMANAYKPMPNSDQFLDTLMPFIAKKHDSMPFERRFDAAFKPHFDLQKTEKDYRILYSGTGKDGFYYMMLRRLEPSIKNDKYAVLCARFKRHASGFMDTSSFEELFWSWKMPLNELHPKAAKLFKMAIEQKDLKPYMPGKENDLYIMFPDGNASYDQKNKIWKAADLSKQ